MHYYNYLIYIFLAIGMIVSVAAKKLTPIAALTAGIVGILVFEGGRYTGIIMLTVFFILGTAATGLKRKKKQQIGAADAHKTGRTPGQVLANGGVAALLGLSGWYAPEYQVLLTYMMAGSLAAATADTLSSEIGTIIGRRFYNILTMKPDERGLDGVVSLEGTIVGIIGAAAIAAIFASSYSWDIGTVWIVLAGFAGNTVDSVLGATLERRKVMGNNMVNFINTLTGALTCWLLFSLQMFYFCK